MLLLIIICVVYANDCSERTSYFRNGFFVNKNYHYYDPTTYTSSTNPMNVQDYKNYIKEKPCTGEWCVENKWGCNKNDNKNCYNVEHIIPKSNNISELKGCNVDVQGNLIMSYGAWNQAMRNAYYGEKVNIYGVEIMMAAYRSVYEVCHKTIPVAYPIQLCLVQSTAINYVIIILFIMCLSVAFLVVYIIYLKTYKVNDNVEMH